MYACIIIFIFDFRIWRHVYLKLAIHIQYLLNIFDLFTITDIHYRTFYDRYFCYNQYLKPWARQKNLVSQRQSISIVT